MKYNELFELEMQLANSGIKTEQYNCDMPNFLFNKEGAKYLLLLLIIEILIIKIIELWLSK